MRGMSAAILIEEFEKNFIDDPDFGEAILYNIGGVTPKPINAVIYRNTNRQQKQVGDRGAGSMPGFYDYEIAISKGSAKGIPVVIEKTETVNIPLNTGDVEKVKFRVAAIIKQDAAAWRLGLIK